MLLSVPFLYTPECRLQACQFILERGKKKEPYASGGGLVFVFTKNTTINFQNTVTAAQFHLLHSYYPSTFFFNAVFCAWISYSESTLCPEF